MAMRVPHVARQACDWLSTGVAIDDFESTITAEGEAEKQGPRQAA